MRNIIVDVESDGLLEEMTKIHSLVIRDVDSDCVVSCADAYDEYPSIEEGLRFIQRAEVVYGHNIISFDAPAIEKVTGYKIPREKIRDTMVIAAMRWAHIKEQDFDRARKTAGTPGAFPAKLAGKHSLEAWGRRLGNFKGTFPPGLDPSLSDEEKKRLKSEAFKTWSKEMQDYCEQDTAVTKSLVLHIRKFGVSAESVETEQELAWFLAAMERNGWPFDIEKATALQAKLSARREELTGELKKQFGCWYKPETKGGEVVVTVPPKDRKFKGTQFFAGAPYVKLELIEFNPGSRQHIAQRLTKLYGWKPTEFTPSGQPEVNEKTLKGLPDVPGVKLLMKYLLVEKRLGQLAEGDQAWLHHATKERSGGGKLTGLYHIHGKVWQSGTITHRSAHSTPNIGQVPKVGSPYGEECRELFYVPEGWVQVGADASGLEAFNLGHYMARFDGGAYAEILLKGDKAKETDVHSANRKALGLPGDTPEMKKVARDGSKNWFYAFMYGGGDKKLGSMLAGIKMPDGTALVPTPAGGWTEAKLEALGKKMKAQFLKNTSALNLLIEQVKAKAKQQGYLTLIDGRRTYVRSDHSALNTLLQSAGAIICKKWIVNFARVLEAEFGPQGWTGKWAALGWIHDEVQIAVRPEIAERVKVILVEEIRKLTQHFAWRVPLDGEAKSGRNWKDTH